MNKKPLNLFGSKRRSALQGVTMFCMAFLALWSVHQCAMAQTADNGQMIEVHGKPIPVGPHCLYMNVATLPVNSSGGLLTVDVGLNGHLTTMVLDTGRLHTELSREEAEKLGLDLHHSKLSDKDADGESSPSYAAMLNAVELGKFVWHKVMLTVTSRSEVDYHALGGADILLNGYQRDLEFSLGMQQIKFFVPSGCDNAFLAYWDDNASQVPLANVSDHDPRQLVTVEINGKKMTALIDSSLAHSTIDLKAAAQISVLPKSAGVTELKVGTIIGDKRAKAWLASFKSFTIGGETINNPKIRIADFAGPGPKEPAFRATLRQAYMAITAHSPPPPRPQDVKTEDDQTEPPDMWLGADFLRSHRVLLAMSQRRMYFSYLGGQVFGKNDDSDLATAATVNEAAY